MADLILGMVIIAIIGAAVAYIVKAKKRGVKCIGCPAAAGCSANLGGIPGCGGCSGNTNDADSYKTNDRF